MLFDLSHSVILGQGLTSIETANFLLSQNRDFQIYSHQENHLPEHLKSYYSQKMKDCSHIWLSPGIPIHDVFLKDIDMKKAYLDIDYFLYHYTKPVILVTGTNGKSTVCRYIESMLVERGYSACCYGNYKPGILSLLHQNVDWVIIELSSYQLSYMRLLNKVAATLLLNISKDHLAWHNGFDRYQQAKYKIHQYSDISVGLGGKYDYLYRIASLEQEGFNPMEALNLAAAMEVLDQLGIKPSVPKKLPKLLYRQNIHFLKDKIFINDSKSTNIESVVIALKVVRKSYPNRSILLILAGIEKTLNHAQLIPWLDENDRIIVIGQSFKSISAYVYQRFSCIAKARSCIMDFNGVILFSPGGASYDQYRNYEERAKDFNRHIFNIGSN
jgi:UDP-N-acetylmuramoylalanine--D-glutamate ligase